MPQNRAISIHSAVNQIPCVTNMAQDAQVRPPIGLHQCPKIAARSGGRAGVDEELLVLCLRFPSRKVAGRS